MQERWKADGLPYRFHWLASVLATGLIGLALLPLPAWAQNSAPAQSPLTVQPTPSASPQPDIQPSFVTLSINKTMSQDMEVLQWPDGGLSMPIKAFAALFDITVQQSDTDRRLFYVDPLSKNRVDIYWDSQSVKVNEQPVSTGKHPLIRNQDGLLAGDDVYVDQSVIESLLNVSFTFDSDTTTLAMTTERKLKLSAASNLSDEADTSESSFRLIRNPQIARGLIEKIYVQNTSTYNYQASQQPSGAGNRLRNDYLYMLLDTPMVGISGSILGQDYYIKPTFVRYNGKANFQDIDWSVAHHFKNSTFSMGATDAGLSPLSSPTLRIWALKLASENASTPFLTPRDAHEFSGKADNGNTVSIRINNRTVQSITAKEGAYEFEPVYLLPQTVNHLSIVEKDPQNREKLLMEKDVANFQNLLPKGEAGYSAFMGRVPLQFHPLIPDQKTPIRLPQSEKWLAGGRYFYGLGHRLTAGVSVAADEIFGKPKTYYDFLNPFSVDLTGFSSYQRDPNFTRGENMALSLRYQIRDHWLTTLDTGISHFDLRSGTLLRNPDSNLGKAAQFHLERQGRSLSWYFDAFHYDPYYYTPTTLLFGNNLYDKQGIGTGVSGSLSKFLALNYNLKWTHYKTNLEQLIPGGYIQANTWNGTLSGRINANNSFGVNFNWLDGANREREFIQRSLDVSYYTHSLPWGISGEVRASHYFTNTLFFASKALGTKLVDSPYHNNLLSTAIDIPLGKAKTTHVKLGNQLSTFVNFAFIQGSFQFKNLFVEPLLQHSYGNKQQTQDRIGARLGYQFKSGARISFSYYKNTNTFNTLTGLVPPSKVKNDQFYVDFTDVIGLLSKRPRSLGPNADYTGVISGTVFADYSMSGTLEKGEPGVRNIKLIVDKQQLAITDSHGRYTLTGLSSGYHTIEVLPDTLPLTLSMENPIYKIKIQPGKNHRVNICLIPEGGTISGAVALSNISGEPLPAKGMILVLKSPDGNTINYTSADETGHYKFSNIPAGSYRIDLEQKLKEGGRYKIMEAPNAVELAPPGNYEESTEIRQQNFKLLAL